MRAFGLIGLLLALLIVGWLAKDQLQHWRLPSSGVESNASEDKALAGARGPAGQLQQFRKQLDQALQTPRPLPDDPK